MNNFKYSIRNLDNPVLFSEEEGFMNGNMFKNIYSEYKNYSPATLNPKTDQEKLLLKLMEANLASHDINLYLDLYPSDGNMLETFNHYRHLGNYLLNEYEEKYGPITINSEALNTSPFLWQTLIYPWNMEGLNDV